jgi:hypothetical protein
MDLCVEKLLSDFSTHANVNRLLQQLRAIVFKHLEQRIVSVIEEQLSDPGFLNRLKAVAACRGMSFKGYKPTSIRLLSGQALAVNSPYFAPVASKQRRSKKRQARTGRHLGLMYVGFIDRCSGLLASSAVQTALLCPSFEIAQDTLGSFGISLDIKTIYRLCMRLGQQGILHRQRISLAETDRAETRSLLVCIDGGRLRERSPKAGRRPAGQKRQGYHTDWREPTQVVIQWLNEQGRKCNETLPIYDATMADIDGVFQLLESYLAQIGAGNADFVIFCADGARRYWARFSALAQKLKINAHAEIIDYTHAKQNLWLLAEQLPKKLGVQKQATLFQEWKTLLWKGKLKEIYDQIRQRIQCPANRRQALKKFKNYFLANSTRMQYAAFRHLDLPTGSGCVESAIRRVINLRLKSPGIFWKRQTAEVMLFLRSTLLCGRWHIMLNNLYRLNRRQFEDCH